MSVGFPCWHKSLEIIIIQLNNASKYTSKSKKNLIDVRYKTGAEFFDDVKNNTELFKFLWSVMVITFHNKKVLLRERKRHTDRRVASTRYAAPGGGWGGTPGGPPT